jgi:diketogulonate reductase-like aldo/keto reductase
MNLSTTASTLFRLAPNKVPFIYGTAWKKETTIPLVLQAISAGFRVFDTAAQPKHYREDLLGEAFREAYASGTVTREDLVIQTKFTPPGGQDLSNMPYDPTQPLDKQIHASLLSSFANLRPRNDDASAEESYIDILLIHSPLATNELTHAAWTVLEQYVPKRIRHLGISNVSLSTLEYLHTHASIKPSAVQNRFYDRTDYDEALREFCNSHDIVYESFWTLTANPGLLKSEPVRKLATDAVASPEVALYALVLNLGTAVLNGTKQAERMRSDPKEISNIRNWSFVYPEKWNHCVEGFKQLIQRTKT